MKNPYLSVVAPVFNEEKCIEEFHRRLAAVLKGNGYEAEMVFVNDGSSDRSLEILKRIRESDRRVRIVDFSRNFGHQIAVKAGIDHAKGDFLVIMDTDLQDAPESIPDLLAKWKEGYDVVYAVRASRKGESIFKKWTAACYYRLMKAIVHVDMPLDAGDFRLVTRNVADVIRGINEKRPYIRGLVSWIGFRQAGVSVHRDPRYAGNTKYTLGKMIQLAWNGITHFSFLPLQISTWVGLLASILCLVWILQTLYVRFVLDIAVPGWTSVMVAVLFLGSVQLVTLGIIGSYLARNFEESRARPLYIVRGKEGFE